MPIRRNCLALVAILVALSMGSSYEAAAQTDPILCVHSDKARYNPAEQVALSLELQGTVTGTQEIVVRYQHLDEIVETQTIPVSSANTNWTWNPPAEDYRGYLAEIEVLDGGLSQGKSSVAVDVLLPIGPDSPGMVFFRNMVS